MQPVYKAPKKIELVEKSSRLKLVAENGAESAGEGSGVGDGWDQDASVEEPEAPTNGAAGEKEGKKEKTRTKKEAKPKIQAVKGAVTNFDD
jgi:hypothetical protein